MIIKQIPQLDWRLSTLIAIGSGAGAAAGCGYLPVWILLLLIFPMIFLPWKRSLLLSAAAAAGLLSGLINNFSNENADREFDHICGNFQGVLEICDSRATAVENLNPPTFYRGYLTVPGCRRKLYVIADMPEDHPPLYRGVRCKIEGVLYPRRAAGYFIREGEIAGEIDQPFGRSRRIRVEKVVEKLPDSGVMAHLSLVRDFILRKFLTNIDSGEVRSMAARLFFGASSGADPEIKNLFVLSGTIHLFAVSGMHVGVLAFLLLWLLRPLDFKLRHRLTALGVLLYVLMSGLSVPAVRAGMVIICWCICRSMLYSVSAWNIVMLTWTAFMIFSPDKSGDIGTQYSFGITAALLLVFEKLHIWRKRSVFESKLMPFRGKRSRDFNRKKYRLYRLVILMTATVTAFGAGCALSLARQHLLLPGSVAANLLMPFVTPLLFAVMFMKLIPGGCFECVDKFCADLLEFGFNILTVAADTAAEIFAPLAAVTPQWYEVLIFYVLFFFALSAKKFKISLVSGTMAILLIVSWGMRFTVRESRVMVLSGGSERPPSIIYMPGGSAERGYVLNVPDMWTGTLAGMELRKAGYCGAEVSFSAGISGTSGGTAALAKRMVNTCIEPFDGKQNRFFRRNMERAGNAGFLTQRVGKAVSVSAKEKNLLCRFDEKVTVSVLDSDDGRVIRVTAPDGEMYQEILPWSSSVMCAQFTL